LSSAVCKVLIKNVLIKRFSKIDRNEKFEYVKQVALREMGTVLYSTLSYSNKNPV